jgi:probable addiction module antidote protein
MREHFGRGWRLYYVQRGPLLIVMLGGGDKSTQTGDIAKAIELASVIEEWAMTDKIRVADLPDFDPAEHLKDDEDMAAYLTLVIEEGDPAELAHALGIVARARGMTEIAKASGLTREALYKALRPNAQPRFETVSRVCQALGVKLVAQPLVRDELSQG